MRPETKDRTHGATTTLAAAAAVLFAAAALNALGTAQAAPVVLGPVNPVTLPVSGHPANSGFTIFVEGDVALNADEAEGTVAAGGDLRFASSYNIAAGGAFPPTFTAPGDAAPTYLYVRGGVDFSTGPTNVLRILNQGYAKIGDTGTYTALDRDQNNALVSYEIVRPGASYGSVPRIEGTITETPAQVAGPVEADLVDIDGAFLAYRDLSARLAQCAATVRLTDDQGAPVTSPIAPGSRAHVFLAGGVTNVLTISATDLAALGELVFDTPPTPSTPLVVNVTGTSFAGTIPNQAGIASGQAPFLLWNFPDATSVTVTGGDSLEGTIYAPDAAVNWQVTQNIEGNVIAASFIHGVAAPGGSAPREVHSFPFSTTVTCTYDDGTTPTPTPTSSTSTPTPTPTSSTPTPTPSPTATPTTTPGPSASTTSTPSSPAGGGFSSDAGDPLAATGSTTGSAWLATAALGAAAIVAGALALILRARRRRP